MGIFWRVLAALFGVGSVAGLVFLVPTVWGKPWFIEHYYLRVLVEFVLEHPMVLSYARVLDPYGLDYYSDDLEDLSVDARMRDAAKVKRFLDGLQAYDRADQTPEQLLSTDVLAWYLEIWEEGEPFLFHAFPVEQFQGYQSALPDFMVNYHSIEDARDAENYLVRLAAFDRVLDQLVERVRVAAERGVVPPDFVLAKVRTEIAGFSGKPASENPLYAKLERSLAEAQIDAGDYLERATRSIEDVIYPGYARLDAQLASLESRASHDAGAWSLPDGDAYYRWALRYHTTTSMTPEEVHQTGLREVARIRLRMAEILDGLGLASADPIATIRDLHQQPRFLYPDSDEGRAQVIADYQAIVDETAARLPALFARIPDAPVVVQRVPPFKEAGSAGAYYNPPSLDGARPGIFYANLRSMKEIARFGMRTLTFHEAIPGHHFQIALAMENRELPLFRRFIPFTAFVEGWALYAERLGLEQGFHPTPYDEIGALVAEMFRAVRLVVDTGIHAKRWTREEAIDYMLGNTGMPRTDVVAEIERYVVAPGQACAYKVGQLRILASRDRAMERLGERFDLRRFHDVVLGQGSLPLEILDPVVDAWIAEQAAAP